MRLYIFGLVLVCASHSAIARTVPNEVVRIVPFRAYTTKTTVVLSGRVVLDPAEAPDVNAGKIANVVDNIRLISVDEVGAVDVQISIGGKRKSVHTDEFGFFELVAPKKVLTFPLPAQYFVELEEHERFIASRKGAEIHVLQSDSPIFVVSDFDDTVVLSHASKKLKMLHEVFTKNSEQLDEVPGASAAYRKLSPRVQGWFYLSSSPFAFYERIQNYLQRKRFPLGPMFLKTLGKDSLLGHKNHKGANLERLIELYPDARFILIGDSGQRDPEIYAGIRERFPKNILGICIRHVGGEKDADRFDGMLVVDDYEGAEATLLQLLPPAK